MFVPYQYSIGPNEFVRGFNNVILAANYGLTVTQMVLNSFSQVPSHTVPGQEGLTVYSLGSNKVGDIAGTNIPCYYSNGAWRTFSSDQPVP
jgi:hypothetical protein